MEQNCSNSNSLGPSPAPKPGCDGPSAEGPAPPWIAGWVGTPVGDVARVHVQRSWRDVLGTVKVRINIRRMDYTVPPGLYALGTPSDDSPVLVSANYKLSFDTLRSVPGMQHAWILVLDTRGVNVWCAAGKGTFGTAELVRRIAATRLDEVVSHRRLIVPQLGAGGVAAHTVKSATGFSVVYGPVRAADLPTFLASDAQATVDMRRVRFDLIDRLTVVPVELALAGWKLILVMSCLVLLGGVCPAGYDTTLAASAGSRAAGMVALAFLSGGLLTPIMLPWLPGRAFSAKGAVMGFVVMLAALPLGMAGGSDVTTVLEWLAWLCMGPAVSSFVAMNFTGASTFTSLSGVLKEMRVAVPAQITASAIGLSIWLVARFY